MVSDNLLSFRCKQGSGIFIYTVCGIADVSVLPLERLTYLLQLNCGQAKDRLKVLALSTHDASGLTQCLRDHS